MGEFRGWLQDKLVRLDGTRERRIIVLGAMALFLILLAGPWSVRTVDAAVKATSSGLRNLTSTAAKPAVLLAPIDASDASAAASTDTTNTDPVIETAAAAANPEPPAPTVKPSLAILFPDQDASLYGSVQLAARISDASAIGVIFDIRDADGYGRAVQASATGVDGVWGAIYDGTPGEYVMSVRASLDDGLVKAFEERRGFSIRTDAGTPTAAPAPQTEFMDL